MIYVDLIARVGIASVLAVSAASKLRSAAALQSFATSLQAFRLPRFVLRAAPYLIVASETSVPVLLIVSPSVPIGYALSMLLMAVFEVGIARAVMSNLRIPCRCFGADGEVLAIRHIVRNAIVFAVAAAGLATHLSSLGANASNGTVADATVGGLLLGLTLIRWDDLVFLVMGSSGSPDLV